VRDSRVAKYEHLARTVFNLRRDETAILCLLLLRGPQTPGELRSRADRMYSFDGLDAVEGTLNRLAASSPETEQSGHSAGIRPLVAVLPRQPGSREARFIHLLGGEPVPADAATLGSHAGARERGRSNAEAMANRVSDLEAEVRELRAAIAQMESRLSALLGTGA